MNESISQVVVETGLSLGQLFGLTILSIVGLYLLGYALKVIWLWVDRGESSLTHFLSYVAPIWIVKINDDRGGYYAHEYSSCRCFKVENATVSFLKPNLKEVSGRLSKHLSYKIEDLEVVRAELPILSMIALLGVAVVASITLFAFLKVPELTLYSLGVIATVFGSRYLRDAQKGLKKLSVALKDHVNDKDAHTSNAKGVDTDTSPKDYSIRDAVYKPDLDH